MRQVVNQKFIKSWLAKSTIMDSEIRLPKPLISGGSLSKHLQPISHFADSPKRDQPIDDLQTNDIACKYYDG